MSIHPKKKDKKGRAGWEIVIRYRQNGRAKRKAFVFRGTKAAAKVFEAAKRLELEAGEPSAGPVVVPSFSDFCVNQYRPSAELDLKHGTWIKRSSQLVTLMEFFGEYRLDEINEELIDTYKRQRRKRGNLKKVSVNNELRVLRRVLNFARLERSVALQPVKVKLFRIGAQRPRVWTEAQIDKLFDACASVSPDILPLLVFLANTGCRRSEALALIWDHVDLERGLIHLWPFEGEGEDDDYETKSRRPREVPISDDLLPWLVGERESPRWVFPCPSTRERYAYWPENKYQRAQKEAGLRGGVHTLRHSYASHFLKNQPDLFLLAEILGHSQLRVTELYSHLLPEHLERGRNVVSFAPTIEPAVVTARRRWRTAEVLSNDSPSATVAESKKPRIVR